MAIGDPGTITFSTDSAAGGGALGVTPNAPNVGVQTPGVGPAAEARSAAEWFSSTGGMSMPETNLPQFLEELAAPQLQKVQQQQMWDGFVAARSGQTMQDISEEQPWYSKVFGPTNYELGAQTYNVLESVSTMETDLLTRMPELRKLPPEAMAQEFNRISQTQMTGNGFADAMLQKTFMDRAGPLMDMHTKERMAWQQAELVKAQYASNSAGSTSYNEMAKRTAMLGSDRPANPAETEKLWQSQKSLIDGLAPSMYQTDESYKAAMTSFVRGAADRGEFHTLKFLKEQGVFSAMDPDDSLALDAYVKQQQRAYKSTYLTNNPQVAEKMALVSLLAARGEGAKPTEAHIDEINAAYMAETGSDDPLYDGGDRASMMAQSAGQHINAQEAVINRRAQAAAAADTEAAKLAVQAEDIRAGLDDWKKGNFSQTVNLPGVDKALLEANVEQEWYKLRDQAPGVALQELVRNASTGRGHILKGVAESYQTRARDVLRSDPNDAAQALFQEWQALKMARAPRLDRDGNVVEGTLSGSTVAAAYFGDGVNAMFNKLQSLTSGGVDFQVAYKIARDEVTTDDPTKFNAGSRKESQATEARVASVLQNTFPRYMGFFGNELGKSGREAAARAMVRAVGETGGLLNTTEEHLMEALNLAKFKYGGENAGKYYWENGQDDDGRVKQSVGGWLGFMDTKETGPAIEAAVDSKLKAHGVTPSRDLTVNIMRMRDGADGSPQLVVHTMGETGFKFIPLTGAEIKAAYHKRAEGMRVRERQAPLPPGYVRMKDGSVQQVSIQRKF